MAETPAAAIMPTDNKVSIVLGVVTFLLCLTTTFVGLRLYIRHRITNSLWWDDWTMLGALLLTIVTGIDMCSMVRFGLGYHIWTLTTQQVSDYFFGFYLSIVFYNAGLGVTKLSILLQYYRIFSAKMRKITIFSIVIIGMWCLALVLTSVLSCVPIAGFWDKSVKARCIPNVPQWYINATGNIITDLFIFTLPIPVLWNLHLPLSQRLSLIGVFGIGFFTCALSVFRISFLNVEDDMTYNNVTPAAWSISELCCGIIGSCLPTLRPIFVRMLPVSGSRSGTAARGGSNRTHTRGPSGALGDNLGDSGVLSSRTKLARPNSSVEELYTPTSKDMELEMEVKGLRPSVPEKDKVGSGSGAGFTGIPHAAEASWNHFGGHKEHPHGVSTIIEGPSTPTWATLKGIQVQTETIIDKS